MYVSALVFVLFVWTIVLYMVLIPYFASKAEDKMMNDASSISAYMVYFVGILIFQIIQGIVQVLPCNGTALPLRITYVILLTGACWTIFAIVLFSRELMRMPFANTFGYLYVSKKLQDALQVLIPKNLTNTNILIDTLKQSSTSLSSSSSSAVDKAFLSEMMKNVLTKTHVEDNYELSTLIRSGTNFIKSLKYINDYTTTIFDTPYIANINQIYATLTKEKKNNNAGMDMADTPDTDTDMPAIVLLSPLVTLLQIVYTRDQIGEFLLLFLVGIMCIVLTMYVVQKNACSAKSLTQINQEVAEYEAQQQQEPQPISQTVEYA